MYTRLTCFQLLLEGGWKWGITALAYQCCFKLLYNEIIVIYYPCNETKSNWDCVETIKVVEGTPWDSLKEAGDSRR